MLLIFWVLLKWGQLRTVKDIEEVRSGKTFISILAPYYIQKRSDQPLLFSFEHNLLTNLISDFNHYMNGVYGQFNLNFLQLHFISTIWCYQAKNKSNFKVYFQNFCWLFSETKYSAKRKDSRAFIRLSFKSIIEL